MVKKLVMIPGPTNVPERVMRAMLTPIINHRSRDFSELYSSVTYKCKQIFQTENEIVVLSSSGTGAVDAAMLSMLRSGDNVVVPSFGEFSSRLGDSARFSGANVIAPEAELGRAPTLDSVEAAMKSVSRVKALCVVYNETSTGVCWRKLRELKEVARRYGALLVVDAISILGGDYIPVDRLGVDVCLTASQKCIAAPPGLSILSISDAAKKAMEELGEAKSQYFHLPRYFKYALTGETPFTPALPLLYALEEALRMIDEEGIEKRIERHRDCARAFYLAFESLGLKPFAEREEERSQTVIGINYPRAQLDDKNFRSILDENFGVLVAGGFGKLKGKMFRVGCMGEINERYVTSTVEAIGETLKLLGHECDPSRALETAWNTLGLARAG